ncbi:MAG: hypothetical protein P1V97_00580 [Planctomycetota bacterium]|nr:hypothetical protein [Planctomycetota bacterium]
MGGDEVAAGMVMDGYIGAGGLSDKSRSCGLIASGEDLHAIDHLRLIADETSKEDLMTARFGDGPANE